MGWYRVNMNCKEGCTHRLGMAFQIPDGPHTRRHRSGLVPQRSAAAGPGTAVARSGLVR
jgi:hypothetical protein